ncbi:MAG: hypothetical protein ACTHK7_19170 [Aureliella sp.]
MSESKNPKSASDRAKAADRNEDPLTGEPGSHPVGTGLGAAVGGAAAGAAAGAVGGPVGAVVGAVAGGVVGGLGGKAVAENIDPTVETDYWRSNYASRPYADPALEYDHYEPAYRVGWESYDGNARFEDRESDLKRRWEATKGSTRLTWEKAKLATRDAWDRVAGTRPKPR